MEERYWKFKELIEEDDEEDPLDSEFNTEENPRPNALVRESIQNSLDAAVSRDDPNKPVRVHFTLGYHQKASYYASLEKHLSTDMRPSFDSSGSVVKHLLIEDFGTNGLKGPFARSEVKSGGNSGEEGDETNKNSLYNFWRVDGKSDKSGGSGGKFGKGKLALYGSSGIRTIFGYWVSHSGLETENQGFFGKTLQTSHDVEGVSYDYKGRFGEVVDNGVFPVTDETSLKSFIEDFGLKRESSVDGFSVIVCNPITELTYDTIKRCVIINYSYPILRGVLEVVIDDGEGRVTVIKRDNIVDEAVDISVSEWEGTEWQGRPKEEIRRHMAFLMEIETSPAADWMHMSNGSNSIEESSLGFPIEKLLARFNNGDLLLFRVPVFIKEKGVNEVGQSYFCLAYKKDESLDRGYAEYYRGGISLPEVPRFKNYGVGGHKARALFQATDPLISDFLGLAENGAHTKWINNKERQLKKYDQAQQTLAYIRNAMRRVIDLFDKVDLDNIDPVDLFSSVFPKLAPKETSDTGPITVKDSNPTKYNLNRTNQGFTVSANKNITEFPDIAEIQVAYAISSGSASGNYMEADFTIEEDFVVECDGDHGAILALAGNTIKFEAYDSSFRFNLAKSDGSKVNLERDIEVVYP